MGGRVMRRRIFLLSLVLALPQLTPAANQNRFIVRTTLGLQSLTQLCLLPTLGCSVVAALDGGLNQLFLLTTPSIVDPTVFLTTLRATPGIVSAELDQLLSMVGGLAKVTTVPSGLSDLRVVTYYNASVRYGYVYQPAAAKVQVLNAQNTFSVTGAGIVADIDTGVDPNHPAFAGVLLQGYDFTRNQQGASEINDLTPTDFPVFPPTACSGSTCPQAAIVNQQSAAILDQQSAAILDTNVKYAAFGHGTMVMGVIHLVAPQAKLLPLKAFKSDGTGYLSDILGAIYYAVQNNAKVVNMSFEFKVSSPDAELQNAITYANQLGVVCSASVCHGRLNLVLALGSLAPATSPPDFNISAAPSAVSIAAGQSASYSASVTPVGGFKGTVTLSCGGAPVVATTCSISPTQVTLDGSNPAMASVTLTTTAHSSFPPPIAPQRLAPPLPLGRLLARFFAYLFVCALLCRLACIPRKRLLVTAAVALPIALLCASCGGGGTSNFSTPPPPPTRKR